MSETTRTILEENFVPPLESLELKALGFDETCLAWYNSKGCLLADITVGYDPSDWVYTQDDMEEGHCIAPTWTHAFKWFRDEHGLYVHSVPEFYVDGINFNWQILWYLPKDQWVKHGSRIHPIADGTGMYGDNGEYPTQEDADLAALRMMISIVKDRIARP